MDIACAVGHRYPIVVVERIVIAWGEDTFGSHVSWVRIFRRCNDARLIIETCAATIKVYTEIFVPRLAVADVHASLLAVHAFCAFHINPLPAPVTCARRKRIRSRHNSDQQSPKKLHVYKVSLKPEEKW